MQRRVKIVPDNDPFAPGEWLDVEKQFIELGALPEFKNAVEVYWFIQRFARPGFHAVAIEVDADLYHFGVNADTVYHFGVGKNG